MNKPTVAERIVRSHHFLRYIHIIGTSIFSIACAVFGFILTLKGATGEFTISTDLKGLKGYASSLAPGLAFVICGTIAICVVACRKKIVMTQHKDENHPGLTSAEH
ncbi:MAG: hypothetical protein IH991_01300 [Planctomycetes bacterium]|nr:hypothetical protein [Planctomycetota bacterium]